MKERLRSATPDSGASAQQTRAPAAGRGNAFLAEQLASDARATAPAAGHGNAFLAEQLIADARTPAARSGRAPGAVSKDALGTKALDPVKGKLTGPELMINDNPETFRSPGLIGSTIAPMKDRGDATHDFTGEMRYFGLSQNGTGRSLKSSLVVKNLEARPLTFTLKGVVFGKNVTKTDGRIPKGYGPSGFRGPHAVAASSFLDAKPGKNGFLEKKVKVGAGEIKVLNEQYHEAGDEIFTLLDVTCDDPKAKFRIAAAESEASLNSKDLTAIGNGTYPSAGLANDKDFAAADRNRLGRPNGVAAGSTFAGGRTIPLSAGLREGDLVLGTRFKHAGAADNESARLTAVPGNKPGVGPAATIDEGNYGMAYAMTYQLQNPTAAPLTCEVLFTAPKNQPKEMHKPLGGELTIPMNVNGQRRNVRVDARGEGVVVGVFTVAPGKTQKVAIDFVHMGNTFPPAGFEFRVP
jgi:hypothetical protein